MLIVREGAKTEPYYFEGLRRAYRVSSGCCALIRHASHATFSRKREKGWRSTVCTYVLSPDEAVIAGRR